MKKTYALLLAVFSPALALAQSVGIGTDTPAPSAALEVQSTTQGVLLPRLTDAKMRAIASPPFGLTIYNTTEAAYYGYQAALAETLFFTSGGGPGQVQHTFTAPQGRLDWVSWQLGAAANQFITAELVVLLWEGATASGAPVLVRTFVVVLPPGSRVSRFDLPSSVALVPGQAYTLRTVLNISAPNVGVTFQSMSAGRKAQPAGWVPLQ